MDVVLEIFDTFAFDYLYAAALPVQNPPYAKLISSLPATTLNATQAEITGSNGYVYSPSTVYFQLEPSKYAYLSAASRDNPYRQALTLFLITWYVPSMPITPSSDKVMVWLFHHLTFNCAGSSA